jgi:hypothetical protein
LACHCYTSSTHGSKENPPLVTGDERVLAWLVIKNSSFQKEKEFSFFFVKIRRRRKKKGERQRKTKEKEIKKTKKKKKKKKLFI